MFRVQSLLREVQCSKFSQLGTRNFDPEIALHLFRPTHAPGEYAMFLMQRKTGDLIRVEDLEQLFDPSSAKVTGRDQSGEEEQEPEPFTKADLAFPSGEQLPRCWTDVNYRRGEVSTSL
jgi:hypothetical protein